MKTLVFVKQVPNTDDVKLDPKTGNLQREGVTSILNPLDANYSSKRNSAARSLQSPWVLPRRKMC